MVGIITPWNFPFILALNPTVQALIAGNAVVLKPSEVAPDSGRLVAELWAAAGLPGGRVQSRAGRRRDRAPRCSRPASTRSRSRAASRRGAASAEACGRRLVPCTLELGGKDPMIVCEDADLERAARGAVYGAFCNAGQVCTSTERVYVVDRVADEFTRRVVAHTGELRQGAERRVRRRADDPRRAARRWSRTTSATRWRRARACSRAAAATRSYAGLFFEPTVLDDVTHDMKIMREETFGPVLPIMRVRDADEAIAYANDSPYGLNANVWTRNRRRGVELAKAIESGCAVVNDCMITYGVARVAVRRREAERDRARERRAGAARHVPHAVDRDRSRRGRDRSCSGFRTRRARRAG